MASPPAVVTSRRRQRELLRSWTGWALTSILIDPTEVARVHAAGWSGTHHRDPETGERIVGSTDGRGFGVDDSWHNPVEVIPRSELEAIARAVTDAVRERLVGFRARWRRHQSAYPRFTASAAAIGCGPVVAGEPLTARQEAYLREHEAFEASGVLPAWERQRAQLDGERLGIHGQAMCLSAGSEAGDLLELLDDQQLGPDADQVDTPVAGMTGAEVRACVEDEHGYVTSTDVPDNEADFFTVCGPDSGGLPRAVSDHPTRDAAQGALEDRLGAGEGQAVESVSEDQVREQGSRLREGKPTRNNGGAAHEAMVPDDQAASSTRPPLLPPTPSTAAPDDAAAHSMEIAPNARGVGR